MLVERHRCIRVQRMEGSSFTRFESEIVRIESASAPVTMHSIPHLA